MSETAVHHSPVRLLVVIGGSQMADRANELLIDEHQPIFYQLRAQGTASNEMMDLLGLGSTQKIVSVSIMPKPFADKMINKLNSTLGLGEPGTGIAFTLLLSGASALTLKILDEYARRELYKTMESDEKHALAGSKNSLIIAVVNQGYSEDVMEVARKAGARGGTVLHARQSGGEAIMNFLGVAIQEEKELILIISNSETKAPIMKAIGENCGMHSEAQGFVIATPIDALVGLGEQ